MAHNPLVTVYITTKNRLNLLKRAIESVEKQTYPNVEIIVCDDGSTDETQPFLEDWSSASKHKVYIRNEVSKGACNARNQAIRLAKGEYITGLDDDDRFTFDRVECFVNNIDNNASFLCSLYMSFDGKKYHKSHYYNKTITYNQIVRRNYVGNQIFIKRSLLIDNNLFFDEKFPAWQDYEFFTRLIRILGPAKRVFKRTYITHTDHEKGRITNPKRIRTGRYLYLKRNKSYMSKSERLSNLINYFCLSETKVGKPYLLMSFKLCNGKDLFKIVKQKINSNYRLGT